MNIYEYIYINICDHQNWKFYIVIVMYYETATINLALKIFH